MQDNVRNVAQQSGTDAGLRQLVEEERRWADIRATRDENIMKPGGGGTQKAFKEETVPGASPTAPDTKKRSLKPELLPDVEHIAVDLADGGIPSADHKAVIEAKWGTPTTKKAKERIASDVFKLMRARGYSEAVIQKIAARFREVWGGRAKSPDA